MIIAGTTLSQSDHNFGPMDAYLSDLSHLDPFISDNEHIWELLSLQTHTYYIDDTIE